VATVEDAHVTGPGGARLSRLPTLDWLLLELEGAEAGIDAVAHADAAEPAGVQRALASSAQ
jgi:hypothetical protein